MARVSLSESPLSCCSYTVDPHNRLHQTIGYLASTSGFARHLDLLGLQNSGPRPPSESQFKKFPTVADYIPLPMAASLSENQTFLLDSAHPGITGKRFSLLRSQPTLYNSPYKALPRSSLIEAHIPTDTEGLYSCREPSSPTKLDISLTNYTFQPLQISRILRGLQHAVLLEPWRSALLPGRDSGSMVPEILRRPPRQMSKGGA